MTCYVPFKVHGAMKCTFCCICCWLTHTLLLVLCEMLHYPVHEFYILPRGAITQFYDVLCTMQFCTVDCPCQTSDTMYIVNIATPYDICTHPSEDHRFKFSFSRHGVLDLELWSSEG